MADETTWGTAATEICGCDCGGALDFWIPAFAGMTAALDCSLRRNDDSPGVRLSPE